MSPPLPCPLCGERLSSSSPFESGIGEHLASAHSGSAGDVWLCGGGEADPDCAYRCRKVEELAEHCLRLGHLADRARQLHSRDQATIKVIALLQRRLLNDTGAPVLHQPTSAAVATQTSEELVAAASGRASLSPELSPSQEAPEAYALFPTAYYAPHGQSEPRVTASPIPGSEEELAMGGFDGQRDGEAAGGVSDGSGQSWVEESAEDEVIGGGGELQETSSQPTQPQPYPAPSAAAAPSAAFAKPRGPSRKAPRAEAAADAPFGQPAAKKPRGRPRKPKEPREPSIPELLAPVKQEAGLADESFQSGSGRRFSLGEKVAAVERVLGGEPKKAVARSLAVCPKVIRDWLSSEHKLRAALNQAA